MRSVALGLLACVFSSLLLAGESAAPAVPAAGAIGPLVEQLASEEFDAREQAERGLLALGKGAVEPLRLALAASTDAEARSRIQRVLDALTPPLAFTVEAVGAARVGQPLKFKVRIKNISGKEQVAVNCLDGSTYGKRYPIFSRVIVPDKKDDEGKRCGNCNEIKGPDLITLKPGEEFDPLGPDGFGTWIAEWTPPAKGAYSVVFSCDYSAKDLSLWNGAAERHQFGLDGLGGALARVPKVKLEAKVEVEVKP